MTEEELKEKLKSAEARIRQQQEQLSKFVPDNRRLADENLDLRRRNDSLLRENGQIREKLPHVGKLNDVAKTAEALYHLMVSMRDQEEASEEEEARLHKVFVDLGLALWRWRGEKPPGIGVDGEEHGDG